MQTPLPGLSVSVRGLSLPLSLTPSALVSFALSRSAWRERLTLKGPLFNWKHLGIGGAAVVGCRGDWGIMGFPRPWWVMGMVRDGRPGFRGWRCYTAPSSQCFLLSVKVSSDPLPNGGGNPAALGLHGITSGSSSPLALCVRRRCQRSRLNNKPVSRNLFWWALAGLCYIQRCRSSYKITIIRNTEDDFRETSQERKEDLIREILFCVPLKKIFLHIHIFFWRFSVLPRPRSSSAALTSVRMTWDTGIKKQTETTPPLKSPRFWTCCWSAETMLVSMETDTLLCSIRGYLKMHYS